MQILGIKKSVLKIFIILFEQDCPEAAVHGVPYIHQEDRLYPPHYYVPSGFSDLLTALLSQIMSEIVFIASK